jgi:hypothetical protein
VSHELRHGRDRRLVRRGGRRPHDGPGLSPLVVVVDEDRRSGDICEALLATSRFAVARVDSVANAVTVVSTLLPDVIVARARDLVPLQRAASPSGIPVVTATYSLREPAALIDAIRAAIRARAAQH